jgi:hypothetical protein
MHEAGRHDRHLMRLFVWNVSIQKSVANKKYLSLICDFLCFFALMDIGFKFKFI